MISTAFRTLTLACVAASLATLGACHPSHASAIMPPPQATLITDEFAAMGTGVEFWLWTQDPNRAHTAVAQAMQELHRLEVLMTSWPHPGWPPSDVMAINAAAGAHPVQVAPETFAVVTAAQHIAALSDGAFDITFAALSGVWHFDADLQKSVPDDGEIARRVNLINFRDIVLTPAQNQVFLRRPGMVMGLGGIAKGYIVDACVHTLRQAGEQDFIVQAGGDLYASGSKGDQAWKVGIRDPRDPLGAPFAWAPIRDHAFSTAGDYERAFVLDGQRYHHILDPRTGHPAHASRSVTIFAPTALIADAVDDAVFIMGPDKGLAMLAAAFADTAALIVDVNNRVVMTPALQGVVQMIREPTPGI